MATKTPIHHKKAAQQGQNFYPYTLKVYGLDAAAQNILIFESEAAYEPERGANPGNFDNESPANDRILLPLWRSECETKQTVMLSKGAWRKRFEISDVMPVGDGLQKTLLVVTPERVG